MKTFNKKMAQASMVPNDRCPSGEGDCGWQLRVWTRKDGSVLVKCGCCDSKVELSSDCQPAGYRDLPDDLQINGVYANLVEWNKVFNFLGFELRRLD